MKAKVEQTPSTNENPVLSVNKNGYVLYSNEAGHLLLDEWGVEVGEKLPTLIRDFAQRVILLNILEKMEVETETRIYLLIFQPLLEEERVNIYGFDISNQKKLEDALRNSDEKLRHVIKHAPTGVFEIDFNGPKYTNVNDAFCQMSGYTREELLSISPFELMVDESKCKLKERIMKTFSGEEISSQEEYLVVGKNGRKLWVLIDAYFTYKNGTIDGALVIAHDITERKQTEKSLGKSERYYRLLFETTLQGIIYHNADGKIISMNPAAEKILGNNTAEFFDSSYVGDKYSTIREDGSPFPVIEHPAMVSLMTGKEVHNVVMGVYNPRENCYRWVNTSSVPIIVLGEDKPFQVYTLLDDITERRQAEEASRESEEKYRNIVETANEGISIVDAELRVTYVNKRIEDMFGYTSEEVIGKSMWCFISGESRDLIKQILKKGLNSINESIEIKCLCKNGLPFWAQVNVKPLFDKDGKFMGVMTMLTDITKRKEAEEALASIEIARKKEIHHRIKNNLQVISSLLDLQAEKFKGKRSIEDSDVLDAFRESQDRVISMALIHEELHKGGAIDTLNFSHYIKDLVDNLFLTYRLGNEGISLDMNVEENIFFDMDTAVPLGIITNELVSNSLKHAFSGRDKGEIRIRLHREEGCNATYILSISDNGVGIPENLEFGNLDSLGLQLVTTLVDQFDGELELKRNNGTESIIRFTVSDQVSEPQLVDNE